MCSELKDRETKVLVAITVEIKLLVRMFCRNIIYPQLVTNEPVVNNAWLQPVLCVDHVVRSLLFIGLLRRRSLP